MSVRKMEQILPVRSSYVGAHCVRSSVFFFSSRRRHTMCYRDWSSDVCSSDLTGAETTPDDELYAGPGHLPRSGCGRDDVPAHHCRPRAGVEVADEQLLQRRIQGEEAAVAQGGERSAPVAAVAPLLAIAEGDV